jgi:hypothetical protein
MKKVLLAFFLLSFISSSQFFQLLSQNYSGQGNIFASEKLNNANSKIKSGSSEETQGSLNMVDSALTVSLGEDITPDGNEVVVPINFQNYGEIGAVSLKIQFDTSVLTFKEVSNQPVAGNFTSNATGNVVAIGWFSTNPLVITNNKFVDLHFTYHGGSCNLNFVTAQCEITDKYGVPFSPIEYVNGSVVGDTVSNKPTIMLDENVTPVGNSVIMPVNIKNLADAGSVTLKVQFDSDVLTFTGHSNQPASGNFSSGASNGVLSFSWFNTAPLGIDSGKFVDLNFIYNSGSSALTFITAQCEITNTQGVPITSVIYVDGSVAANLPPQITSEMPDTVINQNQELTFQYLATDPNPGTELKFSLDKKPEGASIDSLTGLFSWTPLYSQSGDFEVSVIVSDGGMTDTSRTSTITVEVVNQPPQFTSSLSDTTINQMQTLTFQYKASDPNGLKRTHLNSTELKFSPVVLPEGASLDSLTGIFSWTPTYKQLGDFDVIVMVSDGELSDADTAVVTVHKVNVAPYFTDIPIGDTLHANRTYTFKLKADDPNGDPVTFSLGANPPEGASITSDDFKWIISLGQEGSHDITFRVSDGTLSKDTTITVNVGTAVGVEIEHSKTPDTYGLDQNFPNPFNPSTTIRYQIPTSGFISLKIYNVLGKEVTTLVNESKPAGEYRIEFNANNLQSGLYLYQLKAGNYSEVRKMLLIK